MDKLREVTFNDDASNNWFFDRYYYSGANSRYYTFQIVLNLLSQRVLEPLIIETGCQRQKEDLGAGMSTSIFGEYCSKYGGKIFTVDLIESNLNICKECTSEYASFIEYVLSDSVKWLETSQVGVADFLYLDSFDHPYGQLLNCYGGQENINRAISILENMSQEEVLQKHSDLVVPCQAHCLNEFVAAEKSGKVGPKTIILIDDNQLPGGGKSRLLKNHLAAAGWICLMDLQQSLWVKEV